IADMCDQFNESLPAALAEPEGVDQVSEKYARSFGLLKLLGHLASFAGGEISPAIGLELHQIRLISARMDTVRADQFAGKIQFLGMFLFGLCQIRRQQDQTRKQNGKANHLEHRSKTRHRESPSNMRRCSGH